MQGTFDLAFEYFHTAQTLIPKENLALQADCLINIANVYRSLKDFNKAKKLLDQAYDIYYKNQNSTKLANYYNTIGLLEVNQDNNVKAEAYFLDALNINRKQRNRREIARTLNNLCLYKGNLTQQIKWIKEAIDLNKQGKSTWAISENYNNLGVLYYYQQQYHQAINSLDTAYSLALQLGAQELKCDNYRYKSWVYQETNDYKQAYIFLLKLFELENKIMSNSKLRSLELAQAARKIEEQQNELRWNALRKQLLTAAILVLLLLFGSFGWYFRARLKTKATLLAFERQLASKNQQLMQLELATTREYNKDTSIELAQRKKEISNLVLWVKSRNEIFDQIKLMIKDAKKTPADKTLSNINQFIIQCQQNSEDSYFLNEQIITISNTFTQNLIRLHPNLTKTDLKLASFLRIGLTSKEIAQITSSNPQTINMARHRMRKHLDLNAEASLTDYLSSIPI